MTTTDSGQFRFVTYNLRHNADRWDERFPLLSDILLRDAPDILVMQEVWLPFYQAEMLADVLNTLPGTARYTVLTCPKWGDYDVEGISIVTRLPVMLYEHLNLPESGRMAQYARLGLGDSFVDVVNTHLHHLPIADESIRLPQMQRLLRWISERAALRGEHHWVLAGDLNTIPGTETIRLLSQQFRNAIPDGTHTFPTSLVAADFPPGFSVQIDHIFYDDQSLSPLNWQVLGADPHPDDPLLCASDHAGLGVTFEIR